VPLTQAVTSGDAGAVSTVLANGADVNERTGGGQTPLILATIFGHTHLIPLLLEAGADPLLRDNLGLNAVDWAQRRGATEAIEVLTNKRGQGSSNEARTETRSREATRPIPSVTGSAPPERNTDKHRSVSSEEKSQRWLAGLKQRIAEQSQQITDSQRDASEGTNIFMRQPEPPPEIPELPSPTPEIPELPSPQPEIPKPGPDVPELPKPELPDVPPELPEPAPAPQPEIPSEPPISEPPTTEPPVTEPPVAQMRASKAQLQHHVTEPSVSQIAIETEPKPPRSRSGRKRCPKCGAIYNSELVAYCAHHFVPLVDADEPPIISEPSKTSGVMFWMIIIITLTGSLVVGSVLTAFFYGSTRAEPQQAASSPPTPTAVQKGTPVAGPELEGKVASLPIAECPLNGQEAIPGTVVVHIVIDKTGVVKSARATGGDWLLRGAASEAAMKSTFTPEKLRSRETEGTITYTFEP
jgi:hypothetical protein